MVWLNDTQRKTLLLIDDMINKKMTFDEITNYLYAHDYCYRVEVKNGYASKTHFEIMFKNEYTFVDIIKRRNGLAQWETIKIS